MLSRPNFKPNFRSVLGLSFLVVFCLAAGGKGRGPAADDQAIQPPGSALPLQVHYNLEVNSGGEIFPALTFSAAAQYWPVATLTVVNSSKQPIVETVSAEIPDWSRLTQQTVNLGPSEIRVLRLDPELLPRAFSNGEIRQATLAVHANVVGMGVGYDETRTVYLHSASDIFWGNNLANAQFIARWVTPHDPAVIQLVSSARKFAHRGRLAGYELQNSSETAITAQVEDEARGVFSAMQQLGVSYVDSIYTFGKFTTKSERVRMPSESLSTNSANCIDFSVAFASAMENLGMQPVIVLVPGHAFTGVRLAPGSPHVLYLDLTVMPDGTFDSAMRRAGVWLDATPKAQIKIVDIATARSRQIYPMPQNETAIIAQKD